MKRYNDKKYFIYCCDDMVNTSILRPFNFYWICRYHIRLFVYSTLKRLHDYLYNFKEEEREYGRIPVKEDGVYQIYDYEAVLRIRQEGPALTEMMFYKHLYGYLDEEPKYN